MPRTRLAARNTSGVTTRTVRSSTLVTSKLPPPMRKQSKVIRLNSRIVHDVIPGKDDVISRERTAVRSSAHPDGVEGPGLLVGRGRPGFGQARAGFLSDLV